MEFLSKQNKSLWTLAEIGLNNNKNARKNTLSKPVSLNSSALFAIYLKKTKAILLFTVQV